MAGDRPKAFVELAGRTLLEHAVAAVDACPDVEGFVLAAPAGSELAAREVAARSAKLAAVVLGGSTRQASVRAALREVPPGIDAVLCHDVARPLASPKLFAAVLAPLDGAQGVVPAIPVSDTLKRVSGEVVVETVPRDDLVVVQTPQAFLRDALIAAHDRAAGQAATDDATLLEAAGFRVVTVPGEPWNIKITVFEDLRLAEALRADG